MTERNPNAAEPRVSRKFVLIQILLGMAYAAATVFGVAHGYEISIVIALAVISAVLSVAIPPKAPLLNSFIGSCLSALTAVWLQALFLKTYFINNPGYIEIEIPFGLSARLATFILGPINAITYGLIVFALVAIYTVAIKTIRPSKR